MAIAPRGSRVKLTNGKIVDLAEYLSNGMNSDKIGRSKLKGIFGGELKLTRYCDYSSNFSFGADTRKTNNVEIGTGALISIDNNMLKIESGVDANGEVSISTKKVLRYRAGRDAEAMFTTLWSGKNATTTAYVGLFDDLDGFIIGHTGNDFSVILRKGGVDEIVTQDNFNLDKLDGTGYSGFSLDTTKLNIWRINYGYLGIAPIIFEINIPGYGFMPFHVFDKRNKSAVTTVDVPYLSLKSEIKNNGSEENIYMKSGSVYFGTIDGMGDSVYDSSARYFGAKASNKALSSGEQIVMVFHNKETFFSRNNKIDLKLLRVSLAVDGNKPVNVNLFITDIPPDSGTFTDIDTLNSTMEISEDAVYSDLSQLSFQLGWSLAKTGSNNGAEKVDDYNLLLQPGEYAVFVAESSSATEISFTNRWAELF